MQLINITNGLQSMNNHTTCFDSWERTTSNNVQLKLYYSCTLSLTQKLTKRLICVSKLLPTAISLVTIEFESRT